VLNDLDEAIDEWNSAYAQAGSLQLDLQVNTAELEYGMSSSQVQASLASGQNIGLIQYYTGAGGSKAEATGRYWGVLSQ
jgi:hypothetical protein